MARFLEYENYEGDKDTMLITTDRAEEKLVSLLRAARARKNSSGCLHIRGATLSEQAFQSLPDLIGKWFGEAPGDILICEDRDIFIFSEIIDLKVFVRFRDRFRTHPALEDRLVEETGLASFYDFEVSGIGLSELAEVRLEKKILRKREMEERFRVRAAEKRKESILTLPLNPDLVRTIDMRRRARGTVEILVVEDDPFSRRLIETSLAPSFFVSFAENGQSAMTAYLKQAPDVVFLDIDLPDVSGHDVLNRIFEIDPGAWAVMLSGKGNHENIMRAVAAGAKGFVGKPFRKDKLLQCIARCPKQALEKTGA